MDVLNDICVFSFIVFLRVCMSKASHEISNQYTGQGHVLLENEELRDTEGNLISCVLSGESYAIITWKWKDENPPEAEKYLTWTTTELPTDPKLSASTLGFVPSITEAQKREIKTRTIYAIGAHTDDPSKTKQCDDVVLSFIWKPTGKPSVSNNGDPLIFGINNTTQLTCQLTDKGNPKGQVGWMRNGNPQSESENNTQTINIPVTKDIDGDRWQCYYYNTVADGDYSDVVIVNVHWKPEKPSLSISKDPIVTEEDSTAQLTCQLTDKGNPEGQVRWIKHGKLHNETEFNTHIIKIPVNKDIDGDKWQCYYYNTVGDGEYSNEFVINVHWKPEKPVLLINKDPFVIGEGSTVQLTCQFTDKGNPAGQVRWIKNGNLQSGSEYNTQAINIPVTKDINGDRWQCFYNNTVGAGEYSDETMINIHWSPGGATISADTQTPKRDDILTFMCTGDRGNPPGRVLWYLDERLVANVTSKQHTVTNVKESHNGNWSCMFNNYRNNGAQSQSIQIQVQLTPEQGEVRITSITARNVVVNATPKTNTQKARRSIRSTTITNMIITWYSDNDQNNTVLVPPDTTQYALYNLTANTNYTIEVSYVNDQGIGAAATAYVTTKEFPLNLEVDPSIERSWFSAVATLDIANSNSVARVEMLVCESADEMNCENKSTTDIKHGTLEVKETSINGRYVTLSLYDEGFVIAMYSDDIDAPIVAFVLIALGGLLVIVLIIVVIVVIIKKQGKGGKETAMTRSAADGGTDTYSYSNPTMMANSQSRTGTGHAKALNAQPVYAEVPKGRTLAPIAVSADGGIYSQVVLSKKNARQSLKGLPMSKKAIDRIIFHKKDGYVNMTFQVRTKFTGDIEISVCRVGDQSCTSKVSKEQEGGSKDVVMVLPIEEKSPESYSIHMKFIERGQVTQTVDLTYPYNKNLVKVAVLNEVYGTTASHNDRPTNVVSPSNADIEVEGVPQRPPRQGAPGEGVTYAVMDWNRSQAPGRPPRLSSRSPAQEHVVYADVRPGGNVY